MGSHSVEMAAPDHEKFVVLALDESEHSEYAFDWYVQNFHKSCNKLLLVHCPENYANVTMMSPARVEELLMEVNEKVRRLEIKYKAKSDAKKIRYEFVRMPGEKPGHAVLEVAKQSGAIFIVTGTRGMGKLRRTVMGSVSDYILHHSPVPVLICRHKEKDNR